MRAQRKSRGKHERTRQRKNECRDCDAPVSTAARRERYGARSETGAPAMSRTRRYRRRNRLDRRSLAFFWRLVTTGRLVARGVGHRRVRRNQPRLVSLGTRQAKWKLVCRRNVRLGKSSQLPVLSSRLMRLAGKLGTDVHGTPFPLRIQFSRRSFDSRRTNLCVRKLGDAGPCIARSRWSVRLAALSSRRKKSEDQGAYWGGGDVCCIFRACPGSPW